MIQRSTLYGVDPVVALDQLRILTNPATSPKSLARNNIGDARDAHQVLTQLTHQLQAAGDPISLTLRPNALGALS